MPLAEPYPNCCYPGCGEKGVHRHHKWYLHGDRNNPCFCSDEPLYYICAEHHRQITLLNKRFMYSKGGVQGRREVIFKLWIEGKLKAEPE